MKIQIRSLSCPLTAALLDHTERRLRLALIPSADRVRRVAVRLGDGGGPDGRESKYCRIQVFLEDAAPVVIEDSDGNLFAAIERAAERAGHNVFKERVKEKSARPRIPRPAALPAAAGVDESRG